METTTTHALIVRYRRGADAVDDAVAHLTDEQLDRAAPDGGWSARKVVHHLADSEMTSAIRLRRLLVEDDARIDGYDENAFAATLFYDDRPVEASLRAM